MRTSRLVSMLLLLQIKGRVTAQALADEFEVSIRTIYRDIDQLGAAGVPVYADRGPGGGFALLGGYRSHLTGMTKAEAETLPIAGLADAASALGVADAFHSAQLKLVAELPEAAADTSRIGSRLFVDPVDWYKRSAAAPLLPRLAQAVWDEKRIAIEYEGWAASGARTLKPLGLVLKAGDWYLFARAARRGRASEEDRIYKVANIAQLKVLDDTFERPAGFELRDAWLVAVERFERGLLTGTARLRVTEEGLTRLHRMGAAAVEQAHIGALVDGWREVALPIEPVDFAAEQLLRLAGHVEVLEPVELRERLRQVGAQIAALNAPADAKRRRSVASR
ncbi:WYL domain-containing protein [Trinickia violacea]|uniref:WYL domain-containing protein n=2 Tax=Trinickia violacea TaxID=2571746 RepID=A0A4P8IWH1_9BURK|nr:WYL domain-containing protein [Trinickia violacea]